MSAEVSIAVVGSGALAESVAQSIHRSTEYELAGLAEPAVPLPAGAGLVLSIADPGDRLAVVEQANAATLPIVTLPLPDGGARAEAAARGGRVTQVSPLLGFAALGHLQREVASGTLGRRYGLFAAHRVRQGTADVFDAVGLPLLCYASAVLGEAPVSAQVTRAALFGAEPDSWFAILRCADGTLATVEFAASLPRSAPAEQQILVEATGSDAVLRGEPTRQAVTISGQEGVTHQRGWWAEQAPLFVTAAVEAAGTPNPEREVGLLRLIRAVRAAAGTGLPVPVGAA